jgi:ATP-dependent helicase HrpA
MTPNTSRTSSPLRRTRHFLSRPADFLFLRVSSRPSWILLNSNISLPVSARRDDILAALKANRVLILCGETGSGKTTQIPKMCLEAGVAVRSGQADRLHPAAPHRRALGGGAHRAGTRRRAGRHRRLQGALHRQGAPRHRDQGDDRRHPAGRKPGRSAAERYDTIIIDEAHERSLNIDFLLGYLKTLVEKRSDLRVVITSATIDAERFSKHFDDAPVIEVSGRTYPVEIRWRPIEREEPASP